MTEGKNTVLSEEDLKKIKAEIQRLKKAAQEEDLRFKQIYSKAYGRKRNDKDEAENE